MTACRWIRATTGYCVLGAVLCASTGCIVGPDYCRPAIPAPDVWHQTLETGHYANTQEVGYWWELFDDPILNHLVAYAGRENLDLQAAVARIEQAVAQRCIAGSPRRGRLNWNGIYQRQRFAGNSLAFGGGGLPPGVTPGGFARDFWSTGFDFSWEPDVWGRVQRAVDAADAAVGENIELYRDVLVTLYAEVARAYVDVRTLQARIDYARRNIEIQRQALDLAQKRVEGGVSPVLDQHQAASNLAVTESELPPFEAQLHQAMYRLSVLMGEYPGALHQLLCQPKPIPRPPGRLPVVIPCDVIRQRPDIRAAERRLATRTSEVGVAIGDLYPQFSLGGNINLQAQRFDRLFTDDPLSFILGPGVTWPLFAGGRLLCNIDRARAAVDEAFAVYQQTILLAAEEVEDAIVAYNKELKRLRALERAVEATEDSLDSVLELYRGGKTNFQNVLDTQRTLAISQNNLVGSRGQLIQNLILLYKALGGGWDVSHHLQLGTASIRCPERGDPELCEQLIEAGELVSPEEVPATPSEELDEPAELPPLSAAVPETAQRTPEAALASPGTRRGAAASQERGSPIRVLRGMARATESPRSFDENEVPLELPTFDLSDDLKELQPPQRAMPAE